MLAAGRREQALGAVGWSGSRLAGDWGEQVGAVAAGVLAEVVVVVADEEAVTVAVTAALED